MNEKFATGLALMSALGCLAIAAPVQAASRSIEMSVHYFASRCSDLGGKLLGAEPEFSCLIGQVRVTCSFFSGNLAACGWPGIDSQMAVNRLIGLPDAVSLSDGSSASFTGPSDGSGPGKVDPTKAEMAPLSSSMKYEGMKPSGSNSKGMFPAEQKFP